MLSQAVPSFRKHPPHLAEHLDHVGDVLLGGGLEAQLVVDAVGSALAADLLILLLELLTALLPSSEVARPG